MQHIWSRDSLGSGGQSRDEYLYALQYRYNNKIYTVYLPQDPSKNDAIDSKTIAVFRLKPKKFITLPKLKKH